MADPTPETVWPNYPDTDPDRISHTEQHVIDGKVIPVDVPETLEERAARKKQERADAATQEKLTAQLIKDPTSDMGTTTFSPGNTPDEIAERQAQEAHLTDMTDLERVELEHGFQFGTGTDPTSDQAPPSAALVCTNPECPNRNQHVQINTDTILPVRCGNCSTVLLCDHDYQPQQKTEGTLNNPTRVDWTECTTCHDRTPEQRTNLDPVDITQLPIAQAQALLSGTTPDAPA